MSVLDRCGCHGAVPEVRNRRSTDLSQETIAALLGRPPIDTGAAEIAGYITGKRVLVTGAGGSIGSELCRQIHQFAPRELIMLDHDESALHSVYLSIHQNARMDSWQLLLADIRDRVALRRHFEQRRPEVVFHAAALKHLPTLEMYPLEAWKSNVLGTANVVEASRAAGVERFVGISTDKAANPSSVLGLSKRVGERLIAASSREHAGTYLSVRFGNVLGSRGSVLATFAGQIAMGATLTITHPEVSRFFMTSEEASGLVIQAGAIGRPREVLVLDMGDPVRIVDLANRMMTLAGRTVDIVFTGLRDAEKLHEELFADGESDERPLHPLISHAAVPPLAIHQLPSPVTNEDVLDALHRLTLPPAPRMVRQPSSKESEIGHDVQIGAARG